MKLISFAIPCYNSESYMKKCVDSILKAGEDVEIIIVNDGSKDGTADIANSYAKDYPTIVKAVHQENGGHGEAVNSGLKNATGIYFKVVDSDDWLDEEALVSLVSLIKSFEESNYPDLIISNYVYEHAEDNSSYIVNYEGTLLEDSIITWDDIGKFGVSRFMLMHSLLYKRKVLIDSKLELPKHTFYVDNLYAYVPLPYVKTLYYHNVDLYRYYIGRADQSVNEKVMISRIDQQIKVNKLMIKAYHLFEDVPCKKLRNYMFHYLNIINTISSVFSLMSGEGGEEKKDEVWRTLQEHDEKMYNKLRKSFLGKTISIKGKVAKETIILLYKITRKIYKYN